jgi:hypothetical protein
MTITFRSLIMNSHQPLLYHLAVLYKRAKNWHPKKTQKITPHEVFQKIFDKLNVDHIPRIANN